MQIIRGKKALVTGAASGIGRAIALALAREGADLYLVDIDAANLDAAAREAAGLGVAVASRVCDLTDPAQISAMVAAALSGFGALDILVNNAGVAYHGGTQAMSAEQWARVLSVNLLAPIQLVRELLPTLQGRSEAHILNVCSIFGLVAFRRLAAYQTSKYGLVGFTMALRAEYGRRHFGVTALCPGFVRTPMLATFATDDPGGERFPVPDWACTDAERVAARAIRAIRASEGIVVITPAAHVLWGLARLSPRLFDWLARHGWFDHDSRKKPWLRPWR
jgi:NAD(P)-dependent dehydrogenase (short-subunit alcohol dehydrogenase family)